MYWLSVASAMQIDRQTQKKKKLPFFETHLETDFISFPQQINFHVYLSLALNDFFFVSRHCATSSRKYQRFFFFSSFNLF